jgi:RNA polymerase sigma-70 factor (ECF subfamily)
MDEARVLAERFEEHRPRLRAVAYRMLDSLTEADDAVQEAWLSLSRTHAGEIDNLAGWLTTVVGRVSLKMLRSRRVRGEEPWDFRLPEPILDPVDGVDPEHEAILADSVGMALQVVLNTLSPAERLAFVLHDIFAMPFKEIAAIADRTPEAVRQLASRGRRRVRGSPVPDTDSAAQRAVIEAFLVAARRGDLEALVTVLDPEVVLRVDAGPAATSEDRGAEAVARLALTYQWPGQVIRPVLVNGLIGTVGMRRGEPFSVVAYTIRGGKIVEIDILADPARLSRLDLSVLGRQDDAR